MTGTVLTVSCGDTGRTSSIKRPSRDSAAHKSGRRSSSCSQHETPSANLCNSRSCFTIIVSHRYVLLVSICSQYMSQSAHIFSLFLLCHSWQQSALWQKRCNFRPQTLRPCQHEKCSKYFLKAHFVITRYHETRNCRGSGDK